MRKKEITETHNMLGEPNCIRLYTNMWCKLAEMPDEYVRLFLALASRMSYCDAKDLEHSQIVYTCRPWCGDIMKECGWTSRASLQKGLQALTDCNAIRKVDRGVYQVNPSFAGKGSWNYNSKLRRGGISDLVAAFDKS